MARKKARTPEEIVAKLRQADVLVAQGKTAAGTVRTIGVTEPTYYRWWTEFGDLRLDQVRRLEELERENGRLRKAVSDLTLEKVILKGVASGSMSSDPLHCPCWRDPPFGTSPGATQIPA
jgi:hypothetical protein